MTAQVATLELSHTLAVELHGLFRALDLRRRTPELVRAKLDAALHALDQLLLAAASLPDAIRDALQFVAQVLRAWVPDDVRTWSMVKRQLRKAYADFATALRTEQVVVPELRPTNYARSAFHACAALVSLVLVVVLDSTQLVFAAGGFAAWAWTLETLRRVSPGANRRLMAFFRPIAHEQEAHRVNSATWYMTALVLLTLTFSPILCATAVAVLGLADPIAGLVGRRFGRIKLVNGRSLEGSLTFLGVGTVAAVAAMLLVMPSLGLGVAVVSAFVTAFAGALAELLSRRIDDNLSIPMVSAATMAVMLALLGVSPWG